MVKRSMWALLVLIALLASDASAVLSQASPAAETIQATPVASPVATPPGTNAPSSTNPAQQLADRYAPIIGLKDQTEPCDSDGEPFYPVSVDVVLGKDDVTLKRIAGDSSSSDEVVKSAPVAADLYGKNDQYYLDLPGDPRHPGCSYEQWFKANNAGYPPSTYAYIVANGSSQLAIQYWFYYVFNNFNNTHESDWEMIQVLFDVGTVEEALQTSPIAVAAAQHGGGETADWDSTKLQRDGDHPIVFASAGSHATQFGNAVYLGWGENGTGFGCDITTTPTTLTPLAMIMLPSMETDPASPLAWLNFVGRWGERQHGEYNGPTGPVTKRAWTSPFLWQAGLRDSSIKVPIAQTFGPGPANVFCTLSTAGSNVFRVIGDRPPLLLATVLVTLALLAGAVRYVWPALTAAFAIYRRRWTLFLVIGLTLIPIGIAFNGFQYLFSNYPPGEDMIGLVGKTSGSYYILALLTLIAQHLASLLVVGPMVIEVYDEMEKGRRLTFRGALRAMLKRLPDMLKVVGIIVVVVALLGISVLLVPVAVWLVVRWQFAPQAAMMDDAGPRRALALSGASVRGRWWRILVCIMTLFVVAAAPGVLVGLYLMIFQGSSVQLTNAISSVFFVVSIPISILALTLIYRDRTLTGPMFKLVRRLFGRPTPPAPERTNEQAMHAI